MKSLGYVQDTTISAVQGLPGIPAGATWAMIQAEGAAIRWRDDGVNPTATVGMLLGAGQTIRYDIGPLQDFKLIQAASGGILNVTYYRT